MIRKTATVGKENREAWYSEDEVFRYLLEIVWDAALPIMTTIALNPSTATENEDDNTIHRGKDFAVLFGCGGYRMLNAFALRSRDPKKLYLAKDPIGPENTIEFLKENSSDLRIACWGANIATGKWKHHYRGHDIAEAIPDLMCFQKTKDGHPNHPLYLPKSSSLEPFSYA